MINIISFLTAGLAKVYLDDDRLPVIEPVDRRKDEEGNLIQEAMDTRLFNQVVLSFSYPQWKEIVEVWNIETAVITKPQGLDRWYPSHLCCFDVGISTKNLSFENVIYVKPQYMFWTTSVIGHIENFLWLQRVFLHLLHPILILFHRHCYSIVIGDFSPPCYLSLTFKLLFHPLKTVDLFLLGFCLAFVCFVKHWIYTMDVADQTTGVNKVWIFLCLKLMIMTMRRINVLDV